MTRVIIWGLRGVSHTHRYIHKGFFETFSRLGYETYWVDDQPTYNDLLTPGSLVLTVNLACEKLQYRPAVKYILHNVDHERFSNRENVLRLQVTTTAAQGESIDGTIALYDRQARTIYQPWGIPSESEDWIEPHRRPGKVEHWVGSIWNNDQNQGNLTTIADFRRALETYGLKFKQANKMKLGVPAVLGGMGIWLPTSIPEAEATRLVNQSPVGSAVVGDWQKEFEYVPCRLFKNVGAGHLPSSNGNYTKVFPSTFVGGSYEEIIDEVVSLSYPERVAKVAAAQEEMLGYTYSKAIGRLLSVL